MKILMTLKSLTILDLDLVDSNEAILVLNNLPNVQILNGKNIIYSFYQKKESIFQ